jgi:hypothetical protein
VWSLVPPDARERVLAEYGGLDEPGRLRAQVLAVFMGCVILEYAEATGHPALGSFARDALARSLEG